MSLILGLGMAGFAGMHGEEKGMMMEKHMKMPMMSSMHMGGMMKVKIIPAQDGGVIVMSSGKLYKYDKDLNLKKEVEIPMDFEHMKNMYKKMKDNCPMWDPEKKSE
jgi:hypothetical protein